MSQSTAENDDIAIQKSQIQRSIADGIAKKLEEKKNKMI
jgi:hypothetical protein